MRLLLQRIEQEAVLDHVRERLARLDVAGESEKDRTDGVFDAAVGHRHVQDRLRLIRGALPNAERLEQTPRGRDDGRGALVAIMAFAQGRIGHHDRGRGTQALPQRDRERQAGETAAGDHDVDPLVALGHDANTAAKAVITFVCA